MLRIQNRMRCRHHHYSLARQDPYPGLVRGLLLLQLGQVERPRMLSHSFGSGKDASSVLGWWLE